MPEIDPRRLAFGLRIRALRTATGQTQAQAAAATGIYSRYFSEIELGHANVTLDRILTLADHFKVAPASLLDDHARTGMGHHA
ncbi:MAG: XRE family transcriptional regulator [Gordonia sp. (in: high G+C Gram-positive bacteria)]|nr:MAG: XRE family transcriptional regulator [Gordonia sp. (in: high G+C Gram-positive bacteria)]